MSLYGFAPYGHERVGGVQKEALSSPLPLHLNYDYLA